MRNNQQERKIKQERLNEFPELVPIVGNAQVRYPEQQDQPLRNIPEMPKWKPL